MNQDRWELVMENITGVQGARFGKKVGGVWSLRLVVVIGVGVLVSRAFFLQVVMGGRQALVADGNRLEQIMLKADRGAIHDREGRVLARNVVYEGEELREYPYGEVAAHVIGYVGEVSDQELESDESGSLVLGDVVGKLGIETVMEGVLGGEKGEELVETEASGEIVGTIARKDSVPGQTVGLNIDAELQKKIWEVLRNREENNAASFASRRAGKGETLGAVVVSRAGTGEILALVSFPSFDGNLFTGAESKGSYKSVEEVLGDLGRRPMFNRATSGTYPPGSIYKLVTATAGLEDGKIDGGTTVVDEGEIKIDEYRYGNWFYDQYGQTEGEIGLVRAIARSNDIFFYKVGEWVGVDRLGWWSRKLGLGKKTGIDVGTEASGRVPDPLWKEKLTGERWFLGNTYHMAIGQGDLTVTPLQGNLMTAAVVSGKWCDPKVVSGGTNCEDVGISEGSRKMIVQGMKEACSEDGTAFSFFDFLVPVACKTGTAQHGGEDDEPHAWITAVVPGNSRSAFAKAVARQAVGGAGSGQREEGGDKSSVISGQREEGSDQSSDLRVHPEMQDYENGVVITVLLEAAGEGSREAGPVATEIAKYVIETGI